jgi:hypothetical protein
MSFDTLKTNELKKVAESFGIDLPEKSTKQSLILALQDEGITFDMYAKFSGAEQVEIKDEDRPAKKVKLDKTNSVLVRMDRFNPSYSTHGYTFTQQHPFIAMTEDEAQRIFDTEIGFRPATPKEAQEFYN